jgi:hypothetical protein
MKHPGKTATQKWVLDQIGGGNYSPIMQPKTRDALLEAGLIEKISQRVDRGGWPPIVIKEYQMPIHVHIQWCAD